MSNYKLLNNVAVSENGFLFQPLTGESFTLNSVGIMILEGLKTNLNSNQIVENIITEYDVQAAVAERDYEEFLHQLKHHKLVSEQ